MSWCARCVGALGVSYTELHTRQQREHSNSAHPKHTCRPTCSARSMAHSGTSAENGARCCLVDWSMSGRSECFEELYDGGYEESVRQHQHQQIDSRIPIRSASWGLPQTEFEHSYCSSFVLEVGADFLNEGCLVSPLHSRLQTLLLPCVSSAFAAKDTAFAVCFLCIRG